MILAVVISRIFSNTLFKGEDTPFVMELPPYRFPTAKALGRHTWEKGKMYLKKMGGIILVASIIVWALSYFPHPQGLDEHEQQQQSYLATIGKTVTGVQATRIHVETRRWAYGRRWSKGDCGIYNGHSLF